MASTRDLFTIVVHDDDDTGLYYIGEFDYAVSQETQHWLRTEKSRNELARLLEFLARAARKHEAPFA